MGFVLLGLGLIAMKWMEIGPVAAWSWLWVLSPFGLAVAWWGFSDASGLTARREADKIERRAKDRRAKAMEALGISKQAIAAQQARDGAAKKRAKA